MGKINIKVNEIEWNEEEMQYKLKRIHGYWFNDIENKSGRFYKTMGDIIILTEYNPLSAISCLYVYTGEYDFENRMMLVKAGGADSIRYRDEKLWVVLVGGIDVDTMPKNKELVKLMREKKVKVKVI